MAPPRSLADDLRRRDDAALGALLRSRPDLLHPVPADLTSLTARATSGPSVARCLDGLDALHLHVLRVAAEETATDPRSDESIVAAASGALPPEAAEACRQALDDLVGLALVWGDPRGLRAVHPVRGLVAGAGLPSWPTPTAAPTAAHDPHDVDARSALNAREAIARVRDLLDDWSLHPPGILRSGGLSLRELAAARERLHADWPVAAITIEVAQAARLLANDAEELPHWVPTERYDAWLALDSAEQWVELVTAWLALPRLASLADERTQLLSSDRDRGAIPVMRRQVLALCSSAPAGAEIPAERILAVLDDRQPRRSGELRALTVSATLREAAILGLTGSGALSSASRLLLEPIPPDPAARRSRTHAIAEALRRALPADVDTVLIQADLTVVAPGPLVTGVARRLRLLADVESRGHATVYRITEASIRRALDAGQDAASIQSLLGEISRTGVPQPLVYLIDDVARRHGAVRVGGAFAYVRSDSPETLASLVADRRLRALGLSRIADTVVISQAPPYEVIELLRSAGYAPAAESPDGAVVVRRPEERRTKAPHGPRVTSRRSTEAALIDAAVRTLRASDRAAPEHRAGTIVGPAAATEAPRFSTTTIAATLRRSIDEGRPLWIGYADTDGTVTQQVIDPIRLVGGVLTAFDHRTEAVRQYSVSRVTGVAELSPEATAP